MHVYIYLTSYKQCKFNSIASPNLHIRLVLYWGKQWLWHTHKNLWTVSKVCFCNICSKNHDLNFFLAKQKKYNDDNYRKKNNEKIHKTEHLIKNLVCKRRTNACIYTVILTLMFTCKITTLWIPRRNIQLNGKQMFQDILSVRKMFVYLYLILIWLRN